MRGVVDEVFLGAVRADVALQRELARDDFLDGDLLVPAVAAVLLLAARLGDVLGVAERAADLRDGFTGHRLIVSTPHSLPHDLARRGVAWRRARTSLSTYSLTMRRALKRGATLTMAWRTNDSQRARDAVVAVVERRHDLAARAGRRSAPRRRRPARRSRRRRRRRSASRCRRCSPRPTSRRRSRGAARR